MTKILSTTALIAFFGAATAFSPAHHQRASSSLPAVEELASSAMQQSSELHGAVVGPFSGLLEGHHPAQFDTDGGIMMTEHLDEPNLKPGKGFIPPSPMKEAAANASVLAVSAAALHEKKRSRPVPVCYMD
eukprot:CAMPEP_0178884732 /NCGR_PEP_ID=MMETSP0747-20121128/14934_1 /TAXON_ID=913974 /ORGANISM="Nitzschia punctata, Strain CCMP561" /LENGTH=130 /DNA_ID=CAMNT_0020553273 /DNA_START=9 /DNA_END=401 /DNA_ORIENTATION=+